MIHPTADEALAAIITTFESDIAPLVDDEYGASLCRTVGQMLRCVRARIASEGEALDADNADLRALLGALRDHVPADLRDRIDHAPADAAGPYVPIDDLQAEALALRGVLESCIDAIPDRTHPARADVRAYLERHLERQRPWMIDAFTGPRR